MAVADRPQTALDEKVIESVGLEEALEEREKKSNSVRALRKQFKEADNRAKALFNELAIEDEAVVRVGRFRITKSKVPSRSVAFETDPTTRISISTVEPKE
jgi:hypothetical protein